MRDTLIAANPPYSFRHPAYLITPVVAAVVVFRWHPQIARLRKPVLVLDAAGLALFAVTGTQAALRAGLGLAASTLVGVLAAIGGGLLRDVLLRQIPVVLRREIYAVAALAGAVLVCLGNALAPAARALADRHRLCGFRLSAAGHAAALVGARPRETWRTRRVVDRARHRPGG